MFRNAGSVQRANKLTAKEIEKVIARIKQGFSDILEETIKTRKRLEELYIATAFRDKEGFKAFVEKYGLYKDYEYIDTPISIDHILHDMMKASNNTIAHNK